MAQMREVYISRRNDVTKKLHEHKINELPNNVLLHKHKQISTKKFITKSYIQIN